MLAAARGSCACLPSCAVLSSCALCPLAHFCPYDTKLTMTQLFNRVCSSCHLCLSLCDCTPTRTLTLTLTLGALASVRRDQLSMFIAPARRSMDSFFFRFYTLTGKFDAVSLARRCRSLVAVGVSAVYGLWNSLQTPPRPVTRAAPRRTRTISESTVLTAHRLGLPHRTPPVPGAARRARDRKEKCGANKNMAITRLCTAL